MNVVDMKKAKQRMSEQSKVDESGEDESYAEDKAEAAELDAVTRAPKTVLHTTYRGRS